MYLRSHFFGVCVILSHFSDVFSIIECLTIPFTSLICPQILQLTLKLCAVAGSFVYKDRPIQNRKKDDRFSQRRILCSIIFSFRKWSDSWSPNNQKKENTVSRAVSSYRYQICQNRNQNIPRNIENKTDWKYSIYSTFHSQGKKTPKIALTVGSPCSFLDIGSILNQNGGCSQKTSEERYLGRQLWGN